MQNISIEFAQARYAFLTDESIKQLRMTINGTHFRFRKIASVTQNAVENLNAVQGELLQLELEMLPPPAIFQLNNAMSRMSFHVDNIQAPASLDPFDSLSTDNIISQAMAISQLCVNSIRDSVFHRLISLMYFFRMDHEMDIEHN